MRLLAATVVLCLAAAAAGVASAASYGAAVVGLGSGFSTTDEVSGYGNPDEGQCTAGMQTIGHVIYARCALEFDLTTLPSGAVIDSAYLSLHSSSVPICVSLGCDFIIRGYTGNAAFTLGDLTDGSFVGLMKLGLGTTEAIDVTAHVQAILNSDAFPIVGIGIGRFPTNPPEDRTNIDIPAGAHPPTLVVTYSLAYQLTVDRVEIGAGSGHVVSATGGIDCPDVTCTISVLSGTSVVLKAEPAAGSKFDHWTGSPCAGQNATCEFDMPESAVSVVAYFSKIASATPKPTTTAAAKTPAAPTPPPTPDPGLTPTPPPPPPASATPAPAPPVATPTPPPPGPLVPISGNRADWIGPIFLLIIVVIAGVGLLALRRGRRPRARG